MPDVQPTNNPVPSDNPADARDNFKRIDEVVNSTENLTSPTRTGVQLVTLHRYNELVQPNIDGAEAAAVSAAASAAAAEAAVSGLDYQGLWPGSGGSADKGDTYQTQVGGTPTGQYFTALQGTTVDPVGDDVNWREVFGVNNPPQYVDITYTASGGRSALENMIAGTPIAAKNGSSILTNDDGKINRYLVSTVNEGYGYGLVELDSGLLANLISGVDTHSRDIVLMAYYNLPQVRTGEEGLRLAVSTDGHEYKTITKGALPNTIVTTPSVIYQDGYWWLIGDVSSDLGFSLFKSKNLYDWSLVGSNIIPDGLPTFYNLWDVDFIQGADDVYISFNVNTSNSTLSSSSLFFPYISKANDLQSGTFDTASKVSSPDLSDTSSYLDFNVHFYNGVFVAAVKEERLGSKALFTLTSSSLTGTWTNRVDVIVSEVPEYEAPSLSVFNGLLYMYYDRITGQNLSSKSYLYRTTSDLINWSDEVVIDIDITNIRHAYTYNVPEGDARSSITNNAAVFFRPEAESKLLPPESAVFATGTSISDVINGLRVNNYSSIEPLGSNVFGGVGKNKGQIVPAGWYRHKKDQIWNGRGTENLINQSGYTIESGRVSISDDNGRLKINVNTETTSIGVHWDHNCTSGESYTFSMISDRDVSADLQVFDGTAGETVAGLVKMSYNGGGYHLSVTWVAANSGSYRVGLSTITTEVGDVFRIDKTQSENNEFPTPYVDFGVVREDAVMLYEADYLDLRGKYVMCKLSSNFSTVNDYIFQGSLRPDGRHTRIRPQSLNDSDVDNMFVFAVFDDSYDMSFGYWATENNSGALEAQNFFNPTLPPETGFIQLGQAGALANRRSYEYFIVGNFEGSEFYDDGEVVQQIVMDYERSDVVVGQANETAPIPSSNVRRRSDGGIATPISSPTIISSSGAHSPKAEDVLSAVGGVGSVSVTINNTNLKSGDVFYILLASNSSSDVINVVNGGDAIMPSGSDYVISNANENNDALVAFKRTSDGKVRKLI